ncbi:MAG: magnesium/cobalt transporter CorA [Deltaproteobacteria bacterium]|nr:magnesium/cobalt transporter CorA [Nannocystaceae bacterium]
MVWVDVLDPGEPERKLLEEVFRLHPTSVEDMLADAPTPKLERFPNYLYVVWHALLPGWEQRGDFQLCDLDALIGKNFLLTSHNSSLPSVEAAHDRLQKDTAAMRRGPAYWAYLIADVLTERYLPLMEQLDRDIDVLESSIMKDPGPHLLQAIFTLKDKLQRLRRVGVHQREVLNRLSRAGERDQDIIPDDVRPFFRDAYDNFVRVVDLNDSFREIVNSSMDAYLSMQGHKLNEIMKVLTLISTIMLPLTFIAGLYGMNFDPEASAFNMPELKWRYGYLATLISMAVTAALFLWYFKRKRWL